MYCDQAGSYYVTIQCVTSLNWTSFTVSPDTCTVIKQAVTMLQYNVLPVDFFYRQS